MPANFSLVVSRFIDAVIFLTTGQSPTLKVRSVSCSPTEFREQFQEEFKARQTASGCKVSVADILAKYDTDRQITCGPQQQIVLDALAKGMQVGERSRPLLGSACVQSPASASVPGADSRHQTPTATASVPSVEDLRAEVERAKLQKELLELQKGHAQQAADVAKLRYREVELKRKAMRGKAQIVTSLAAGGVPACFIVGTTLCSEFF